MNNEPFKKFMEICQENYPLITILFGKFIDFDEKFCFNIQGGLTYSAAAMLLCISGMNFASFGFSATIVISAFVT